MLRRALTIASTSLFFWLGCGTLAEPVGLSCTITSGAPAFGNYSPTSGRSDSAMGTISVNCSLATSAMVAISTGSGTFAMRKMLGPNNAPLGYNLYIDSGDTMVWGDGTAGTSTQTYSLTALVANSKPVYGLIPGSQDEPAGTYNDTPTLTVSF